MPEKAIIENVSLTLHMTRGNPSPVNMNLHRVLDDWHEGPSSSAGGGGAVAQPGDATWLHTNYDVEYWKRVGGFYVPRASAMTVVSGSAFYTWQHNPHMLADVRRWLRAPHRNFGWILLGDENAPQSVKRFDSRETTADEYRPVLTINYRLPGNHNCSKEKE